MPDDGRRHELVDGVLLVTPAPARRHQRALINLVILLEAACPEHLEVLVAPFDVALGESTVLQPDVLVARRIDLTERDLPSAPVLAVEVLSPSTRRVDLHLKRAVLEAAGCPSYWAVDPEEPAVTVWQLRDGRYVEVAHVAGAERVDLDAPYPLTVCPALLAG
jgi:Uma2 family endonuclease